MKTLIKNNLDTFIPILVVAVFASIYWVTLFQPTTVKTCESSLVVDKRFTGEGNDIMTIYADTNGKIIGNTTDSDVYYNVEKGDEVNYCAYVGKYIPIPMFSRFERIEQ